MERQAKDGTIYEQVGQDEWKPVTRTARDGTVYKKVGQDDWQPMSQPAQKEEGIGTKILHGVEAVGRAIDSYTGAPTRKAIGALQDGDNPISAFKDQFGENPDLAPTGKQIAQKAGVPDTPLSQVAPNHFSDYRDPELERLEKIAAGKSLWSDEAKAVRDYFERLPKEAQIELQKPRRGGANDITASGAAGLGVDVLADPTLAAGKIAKGVEYAGKGIQELAKVTPIVKDINVAAIPGKVAEGAKSAGKTAITAFLGPNREAIDRYLARASEVKGAKSVEEIKNVLDDTVQGLFDDVSNSKISQEEAKEALKGIEEHIKDTSRDASFQFRVKHADVKEALREANSKLDNAFKVETDKLSAVKSPIQLADDVQTSIQDLKKKVSQGSKEAYDILGNSDIKVKTTPIWSEMQGVADSMRPGGIAPLTEQGQKAHSTIQNLAAKLKELPETITGPQAKQFIQELDNVIDYGQRNGEFSGDVSNALLNLRRNFDQQLKSLPAYQQKMAEIADNTRLLKSASERFGDSRAAVSRLNSIAGRTAGEDRELLEKLGTITGRDFKNPVSQFESAQGVLKDQNALEQIKSSLPEYSNAKKLELESQQLARPEASPEFVESQLRAKGLPEKRSAAESQFQNASQKLSEAEEKLKPYKSLGPMNTQNAIKGLMKAPGSENIELRRTIEDLSKMSGKDFANMIADRRAADAFKGEFRIGSRNVNLWGMFGFVTGGPMGAAGSATVGALVDRFGPQMAQKILDGVLKIQGMPTPIKIDALALPAPAKEFLKSSLVEARSAAIPLRQGGQVRTAEQPDNSVSLPKKGPEKWVNDGAEKLKEHTAGKLPDGALNELKKTEKGKDLLIQASNFKPGSKGMQNILLKIQSMQRGS
jgi:hypothetical protein